MEGREPLPPPFDDSAVAELERTLSPRLNVSTSFMVRLASGSVPRVPDERFEEWLKEAGLHGSLIAPATATLGVPLFIISRNFMKL